MDHAREAISREQSSDRRTVGYIHFGELERRILLENRKTRLLQVLIIVIVQIVHANDAPTGLEQPPGNVKSDKPRRAGYKD